MSSRSGNRSNEVPIIRPSAMVARRAVSRLERMYWWIDILSVRGSSDGLASKYDIAAYVGTYVLLETVSLRKVMGVVNREAIY